MRISNKKNGNASVLFGFLIISLFFLEVLSAETRYRVKSSDNLNTIVERFYKDSELTKAQLLVGILAENPRAFKGGNVNFLLRGKRLILPDESEFQQVSPESASEILSEHARFFRHGITGDFPLLSLAELAINQESTVEPSDILAKQKVQTQKIEQLERESQDLKKQLEALVNEKSDRDQRLVELEESLRQALGIAKNAKPVVDSVKKQALERSNKQLQKELNITKSELVENSKSTTELERKVDGLNEILNKEKNMEQAIDPRTGVFPNLYWLFPLALLMGFLFYLFRKKKKLAINSDEKIELSESGYIEPYEERVIDSGEIVAEEEPLETSVKLDVARAYIEAEDTQSALNILGEIIEEGTDEQRKVAHELLDRISPN